MSKKRQRKTPSAAISPQPTKQPAFATRPDVRKVPNVGPSTSVNDQHPSWRISRLELVDPFGWHIIDGPLLHAIHQKLAHFESKTWNEILVKEKHRNHTVPVTKLCSDARGRLAALKLDDLEEIVSLRLTGPQRVWGYRIEAVLHLLWWDPEHGVYSG